MRKIAGLDAIDESVKRCVELGRPILASPGYRDLRSNAISILSGVALIRYLARETARLNIPMYMPTGDANVYSIVVQNYRSGCMEGDNAEAFDVNKVFYFSNEQWSFVSSTMALIDTVNPGTLILVGSWAAETIYFGAQAKRIGAMLIGGTPTFSQASFFSCVADYTLLGDELFAASAYVSNDPELIGDLTTQDVLKWISAVITLVGAVVMTLGSDLIYQVVTM